MKSDKVTSEEFKKFALDYQKGLIKSHELGAFFFRLRNMIHSMKFKDPSGVLDYEDFESIGFLGFLKALQKFDEKKSQDGVLWAYMIMRQVILQEVKKITKKGMMFQNSIVNSKSDELILNFNQPDEYNFEDFIAYVPEQGIEALQTFIWYVEESNVKASKLLQLKLVFPNLSRSTLSKILGYKRRNQICKLIKVLKLSFFQYNDLIKELVDVS